MATVPTNEVRTKTVKVLRGDLYELFDKLNENPNVIKIEHAPDGAFFAVTVHYAIMDLALQLGRIDGLIETTAREIERQPVLR